MLAPGANEAWPGGARAAEMVKAQPGSIVVVDLEIDVDIAYRAIESGRRKGAQVVLDPAPAGKLEPDILASVDHITPNQTEAEQITGIAVDSPGTGSEAARELCKRGVRHAYVKLPDGGCALAADNRDPLVIRGPSGVPVVDSTGAGDAFAAGLASSLLEGRRPEEAAVTAVAASFCSITGYGAQASYPSLEELAAMTGRVREANA